MDLRSVLLEIDTWPIEDRLQLVHEVWDRLMDQGYDPGLSDEMTAELDRRIERMDRDPGSGIPWDEVKARVLGRLRR